MGEETPLTASLSQKAGTDQARHLQHDANVGGAGGVPWSEIDKTKFYGIGTGMYSALNVLLNPITVLKINQQASNTQRQPSLREAFRRVVMQQQTCSQSLPSSGASPTATVTVRPLYRGLGVVLSLAVPARALYIGILENSREGISNQVLNAMATHAALGPEEAHTYLPLVATFSSGLAGGIAAVAAQCLVVPMDVISQRQMTMEPAAYARDGSAASIARSIVRTEGTAGLFRGFGLSIFSSMPTGTVWWAVYSGCQTRMSPFSRMRSEMGETEGSFAYLARKSVVQLAAGISAAAVAATLTQPLDTTKTRLQLQIEGSSQEQHNSNNSNSKPTYASVARELKMKSGYAGFFKGTGARIIHMGLWGTILSSAYELLRHVSRKDGG
jgi:solute carrier family 25 protein 44